ncbi:MAG: glycoside hydrolase family 130 protein [Saprospiraceae bacterium]
MQVQRSNIHLYADPKRVILNFFNQGVIADSKRAQSLINRVLDIPEDKLAVLLDEVKIAFNHRHHFFEEFLLYHASLVQEGVPQFEQLSNHRKQLLGAYFTKEYSIQAAALFNPSIVVHPNQDGLKIGQKRFLYTLRSVGEGHISSIEFRSGIIDQEGHIELEVVSPFSTTCRKKLDKSYIASEVEKRMHVLPDFNPKILQELPSTFSIIDYNRLKSKHTFDKYDESSQKHLDTYLDTNYDVDALPNTSLSERVIFPNARQESKGMEDVRLVAFQAEDQIQYIGTYTAYDGLSISPQLIITKDFQHFEVRTMYGAAVNDKGMALFPEKVNGQYVMLGRQGGTNISIMYSDNLFEWNDYEKLIGPEEDWGLVQLGNCGAPIRTEAGWLVITHGVGPLRKYVLGAILLDLEDPSKIIRKLRQPLLGPNEVEREGYVPNVVYSCGSLIHAGKLLIPYALSDSATTFATVDVVDLIARMELQN